MSELMPLGAVDEEVIAVPLDEIREWEKRFKDARQRRREAQEEEDEAKEVLKEYLGDAEFGSVGGKITLRYRSMSVRRFNTKKFRKVHPDLADEFTEENEERRMEVIEDDE
jgi:predicted phage-related endonuclease